MLRTPQLKPFIIYIKPPKFELLKETRNKARARSTFDENNSRGFTVILNLNFFLITPVYMDFVTELDMPWFSDIKKGKNIFSRKSLLLYLEECFYKI